MAKLTSDQRRARKKKLAKKEAVKSAITKSLKGNARYAAVSIVSDASCDGTIVKYAELAANFNKLSVAHKFSEHFERVRQCEAIAAIQESTQHLADLHDLTFKSGMRSAPLCSRIYEVDLNTQATRCFPFSAKWAMDSNQSVDESIRKYFECTPTAGAVVWLIGKTIGKTFLHIVILASRDGEQQYFILTPTQWLPIHSPREAKLVLDMQDLSVGDGSNREVVGEDLFLSNVQTVINSMPVQNVEKGDFMGLATMVASDWCMEIEDLVVASLDKRDIFRDSIRSQLQNEYERSVSRLQRTIDDLNAQLSQFKRRAALSERAPVARNENSPQKIHVSLSARLSSIF